MQFGSNLGLKSMKMRSGRTGKGGRAVPRATLPPGNQFLSAAALKRRLLGVPRSTHIEPRGEKKLPEDASGGHPYATSTKSRIFKDVLNKITVFEGSWDPENPPEAVKIGAQSIPKRLLKHRGTQTRRKHDSRPEKPGRGSGIRTPGPTLVDRIYI